MGGGEGVAGLSGYGISLLLGQSVSQKGYEGGKRIHHLGWRLLPGRVRVLSNENVETNGEAAFLLQARMNLCSVHCGEDLLFSDKEKAECGNAYVILGWII